MTDDFRVAAASGSLRTDLPADLHFSHGWSAEGVVVQTSFTGAHLLHLSVAGCVLNDLHREAIALDVPLEGVLVEVAGSFDTDTWRSGGITYRVQVDSSASAADVARLLARVDEVAEIPRVLRAGAHVGRIE